MLIAGRLKSNRLCDHIRSFREVLAGITRVLVIGIAEINNRQILCGKSDGIHIQNVSIVLRALHESAIVRQHHGTAIICESQECNVILSNLKAGCSRLIGWEQIHVRFDSNDRSLFFRPRRRRSIGGLQSLEP